MAEWVRIPLIDDVEGIVILLPPTPLSEANWQQFMRSLEVMKPGLVERPESKCTGCSYCSDDPDAPMSFVDALTS